MIEKIGKFIEEYYPLISWALRDKGVFRFVMRHIVDYLNDEDLINYLLINEQKVKDFVERYNNNVRKFITLAINYIKEEVKNGTIN